MADTYNIGPTVPALFAAHEARYKEAGKEIERLRAENEALRVLLTAAMDELESVYDAMYPAREEYPSEMRRYKRDMDLVNRIRDALRGEGEK